MIGKLSEFSLLFILVRSLSFAVFSRLISSYLPLWVSPMDAPKLGLLGRDEGRAQPARSAGVDDACTPVRRASLLHSASLLSVDEGGRRIEGGAEQCACCCSVELIYTTRFDASVVTHRGLIRCSSGESEGTSVG